MINIIFVEPESSGNIGSLTRAMKNFSLKNLILVNPCEINQETRKMAMSSWDLVENARKVNSFEKAIEGMDFIISTTAKISSDYNGVKTAYSPKEILEQLKQVEGNIAIVFGRESSGLTQEELEKCDISLFIPANLESPTLNISHAAAIVFYELFSNKDSKVRKANLKEKQALIKTVDKLIENSSVKDVDGTKRIFANVINRSLIAGKESHCLMGFFTKLQNKKH